MVVTAAFSEGTMEEHITFASGPISLEGLLSRPKVPTEVAAVVCHPHPLYGGEMHNNVVTALVNGFAQAGAATLRFNFRGVGRSGGTHDQGNAEQDDVIAAVTCLLAQHTPKTVIVAGYSFGSFVGLKAGAADARVHKLLGVALPIASRDASFLEGITKPKLLVCGDRDSHAPLDRMQALVAKIPEPKMLTIVNAADHFFQGLENDIESAAYHFARG